MRAKWPSRSWRRWWTTRSRRARMKDFMWSTRLLSKFIQTFIWRCITLISYEAIPSQIALITGLPYFEVKPSTIASLLRNSRLIMMFYFKVNACALCSHFHALRAHINAFSYFFYMYTLPRGGMYWGRKVSRGPRDLLWQGLCFAPISNVDVS